MLEMCFSNYQVVDKCKANTFHAVLIIFIRLLQYLVICFISRSIFIYNKKKSNLSMTMFSGINSKCVHIFFSEIKSETWKLILSLWGFLASFPLTRVSYPFCSTAVLSWHAKPTFFVFRWFPCWFPLSTAFEVLSVTSLLCELHFQWHLISAQLSPGSMKLTVVLGGNGQMGCKFI